MPFAAALPYIIPAVAGLAGGLGGTKGANTKTTDQQTHQTQTQSGTQTTTPNLDPATQSFLNQIRNQYSNYLTQDPNLTGYQAGGLQQINHTSDLQQKALANTLASRGLSYSPAGASSIANGESQRFAQSSQFNNSIPMLARQQMMDTLGAAGQFASTIPHGYTQTGNQTTTTDGTMNATQVDPHSPTAGFLGNMGTTLAYLYGKGAYDKKS